MLKAIASSIWNLAFDERPDYDLIIRCLIAFLKSHTRLFRMGGALCSPMDITQFNYDWNSQQSMNFSSELKNGPLPGTTGTGNTSNHL